MVTDVQFFRPATIEEAVMLLREHAPDARPLAGGTDLVVHTRTGRSSLPRALVYLGGVGGLDRIEEESGGIRIGALVTHRDIERSAVIQRHWSALSDACGIVGSPATRHVGTVGGNLCNGSPAMEIGGPLLAFDATVDLIGPDGARTLSLHELFVAPGVTARRPDELLASVFVPAPEGRVGSAYQRLEFRRAMEIAIVGVTAALALDGDGTLVDARIALTAVAPVIIRATEAEAVLRGARPDEETLTRAADLAAQAGSPIDDVRAPAGYRRAMIKELTNRTLRSALARAEQQ